MSRGLSRGRGKRFFSSPKRADPFWGPTSLLFNGSPGYVLGQSCRGVRLTTHLHLDPTLSSGAIPQRNIFTFLPYPFTAVSCVHVCILCHWNCTENAFTRAIKLTMLVFIISSEIPFGVRRPSRFSHSLFTDLAFDDVIV
jgi:hypothetical protein